MSVTSSEKVARNGALYFLSLGVAAVTAVFLVPVTVRHLGPARFGLLALAWAVAEGTGMFDFGLARTTVRYVADATARGEERLREIVLASVVSQTAMGVVAGLLVFLLAPVLVNRVFNIDPAVRPEAIAMFRVLGLHIPVLLGLSALRAALEGAQRFDITTAIRVPGSVATVAIPAFAAASDASLPTIVWILLGVRLLLAVVSAFAVSRTLLRSSWRLPPSFAPVREMLGYSGWVAISAALGPALGSLDRFVVGSVAGVAALGYYTGAAEAATRFLLIPATAFSAILPALAQTEARGARDRVLFATRAATRQLAALLFPICLILFVFAEPILRIWLGETFAAQATTALRVLAIGVFFGGIAHLPLALLYGAARPDLPAKIHSAQAILYVPFTLFLVRTWGIGGAACAWTLRCTSDWLCYEWAVRSAIGRATPEPPETSRIRHFLIVAIAMCVVLGLISLVLNVGMTTRIAIGAIAIAAYFAYGWWKVLSDEERRAWLGLVTRVLPAMGVLMVASSAFAQVPSRPDSDTTTRVHPDSDTSTIVRAVSTDSVVALGYLLIRVNDESVDRARFGQLRDGVPRGNSLLLRSASSLSREESMERPSRVFFSTINPDFLLVSNTALAFSQNNGSLWAGKGLSTRILGGFRIDGGRFRLIVAPELALSSNRDWVPLRAPYHYPVVPPGRNAFSFPYYVGTFSIDQPLRYGNAPVRRLDPGQTTALVSTDRYEFGFSTESEWWGPGIRNAIVLSNNAPGFPHLFARNARPLQTRLGDVAFRWLVGGLTESKFFDTVSTNNVRSLSSFVVTVQPAANPDLSFGAARSVYANAGGWGQFPWRWLDVFARTHTRGTPPNRDQLFSLFTRWVLPDDGFELYAEWARLRMNPSIRDLVTAPNHTQGYTLGFQWRGAEWKGGAFRLQSEVTQLEQSATWRDRPGPSWYSSDNVPQGYTNRGQVLGASIGPGASSQWFAVDYIKPLWRLGAFAGRIRWNEDVHSNAHLPVYVGYCSHDVSVYPGIRGAVSGPVGQVTVDASFQNRMNLFFQNDGGCPNIGQRLDVRNTTLSITYSPFRQH